MDDEEEVTRDSVSSSSSMRIGWTRFRPGVDIDRVRSLVYFVYLARIRISFILYVYIDLLFAERKRTADKRFLSLRYSSTMKRNRNRCSTSIVRKSIFIILKKSQINEFYKYSGKSIIRVNTLEV